MNPAGCEFHGPAPYSDAARRIADSITLHILANEHGYWAAYRLADGGTDHTAYLSRADAIKHQFHESFCFYVLIPRDQMSAHEAEHLLHFYRECRDRGIPIAAPEYELIPPNRLGLRPW